MSEFFPTFAGFLNQGHPLLSKLLRSNSSGLVSHNRKETLIDLALISSSSKLKECSVIPPLSNSDHDGIHLALRMLSIASRVVTVGFP